jgi:hypothetical protein
MAIQAISMSPSLAETYKALPFPLQRAMGMTTVFKFCKRPATLYDDPNDEYSSAARELLNLLKEKNLLPGVPPSNMIGLKCGYCHNFRTRHVSGSVSFIAVGDYYNKGILSSSLQQRAAHLCTCADANRTQILANYLTLYHSFETTPNVNSLKFEDEWMRFIQRVPFDSFPYGKAPIHLQQNTYYIQTVGDQYWSGNRLQQLQEVFTEELNFLERSLFCVELLSEDDTKRDYVEETDTMPDVDMFVPLTYRHVADCENETVFYDMEDVSSSPVSSKRSWQAMETPSSASGSVQIHGKIGIHDVVMPRPGCSLGVVRTVYNLGCNRRFMKLVSKYRHKYSTLATDEERMELVQEVVLTVEKYKGGHFRNVNRRELDGAAVVSKSRSKEEVLAYVHNRLHNGFPDVFTICSKGGVPVQAFAEPSKDEPIYIRKAIKLEHVPHVGLLWGDLTWRSRPNGGVTLGDMKQGNQLQSSQSCSQATTGRDEKIPHVNESDGEKMDIEMSGNDYFNGPEDHDSRRLSSTSAVTTVSEESVQSTIGKGVGQSPSLVLPISAPCVSVDLKR